MKTVTTILALCTLLAVTAAFRVLINNEGQDTPHLLGAKVCTWGPGYWCTNFTTARQCEAMQHCIPKDWETRVVPEDNDSVCSVCKDMVQQARDQLESNQTQSDLKAVFEGSCALIQIKPIVKECKKVVDQFIPELVETLASQMNPSVVCSVAGLCNSAHFDKLLELYENPADQKDSEIATSVDEDENSPSECSKCYTIAHHMEHKFAEASRDSVLERLLDICGQFSSFSDACSSLVLKYFEDLYSHLKSNLKADNVCHLSGQCSYKFHIHEDDTDKTPAVEIRPLSSVGKVEVRDDLPCKLCEQLVTHLRDLLVANTTETEFQQVLEGLCKQTKSFAPECKAVVDEYYPQIYNYLTEKLNGNAVCQMGGLCPAPGKESKPLWPMISNEHAKIAVKILGKEEPSAPTAEEMQLPLERLSSGSMSFSVADDTYCPVCEFVMQYVKKNVRNPKDKNEVELVLKEVQSSLPSIQGESENENFLDKYGTALSVLILQGNDLSKICPMVAVCPSDQLIEAWKKIPSEFKQKSDVKDKPSCPLCLMAITKLEELVKDNKTEASIEEALHKLCQALPKSLEEQCVDLVQVYTKEIISKMLEDLTPEQVCAEFKLCEQQQVSLPRLHIGEKIVAVPKNDVEGKETCALCEYVLHFIQQAITDPKAEQDVKNVINKVCNKLPKSVRADCNQFVDAYGEALVAVLAQEIDPSQICPMFHICPSAELLRAWGKIPKETLKMEESGDKPYCPLCLLGVTQLYNTIRNNKTEASIKAAMEKLCDHLSKSLISQCESFVEEYSGKIIELILSDLTPQQVCVSLKVCESEEDDEPLITFYPLDKDGEIMTNEIPNYPVYTVDTYPSEQTQKVPKVDDVADDVECTVCEYIMKYVEQFMSTRRSKDEIEHMIHNICNHLPKHMSQKCNNFVNEYAEIVIELLAQEVSPKEVCTVVGLCKADTTKIRESISQCALCRAIITNIEKITGNLRANDNLFKITSNVCKYMPKNDEIKCYEIMSNHGEDMLNRLRVNSNTRDVCSNVSLCSSNDSIIMLSKGRRVRREMNDQDLGTKPCTWGESYWCSDASRAEECKATDFCTKRGQLPESSTTVIGTTSENPEISSKLVLTSSVASVSDNNGSTLGFDFSSQATPELKQTTNGNDN
ncbi:hypothetical protein QAD02_017122 [Eretmocerus hayati]|uniref:Uncharacterized protein n=1 Tax=Eretmocerus hayati TaxID=131215 RepID=A0ACC2PD44_9HYME|nr:hypothetical protein QAD02_017122 [Eretmocerus hayati]